METICQNGLMRERKPLLPLTNDFVFKLLFGDQRNVDILAEFLGAILDLNTNEYEELTIVNPILKPEVVDEKEGILDVKLTTKSKKVINIEIQVKSVPEMKERIIFYTSKMITEQISKKNRYNVIKKVISIVIMDYTMFEDVAEYHNKFVYYNKKNGLQFTDLVEIHTLEVPKALQGTEQTELSNWMRLLKAGEEEMVMLARKNPSMQKAYETLRFMSEDERTVQVYESRLKAWRDEESRKSAAIAEALEQERAINEKRLEQERAINEKRLEQERIAAADLEKRRIVLCLLKLGVPLEQVVQASNLPYEEVEKIAKKIETD